MRIFFYVGGALSPPSEYENDIPAFYPGNSPPEWSVLILRDILIIYLF